MGLPAVATLAAALNRAMREEIITRNVAALVTLPARSRPSARCGTWSSCGTSWTSPATTRSTVLEPVLEVLGDGRCVVRRGQAAAVAVLDREELGVRFLPGCAVDDLAAAGAVGGEDVGGADPLVVRGALVDGPGAVGQAASVLAGRHQRLLSTRWATKVVTAWAGMRRLRPTFTEPSSPERMRS